MTSRARRRTRQTSASARRRWHLAFIGPQGFTLLELLLVLAILGTITGLTLPNLRSLHGRVQLEEAAYALATDCQRAHVEALAARAVVELALPASGPGRYEVRAHRAQRQSPWNFCPTRSGSASSEDSSATIRVHTLPGTCRVTSSSDRIIFRPDGMATDASILITSTEARGAIEVRIEAGSGRAILTPVKRLEQ
jgi:type II secretion system protein H